MAEYGQPDWVNPNNASAEAVSEANVEPGVVASPKGSGQNGQGSTGKASWLLILLSMMNMLLAFEMAALGVLTLIKVHNGGMGNRSSSSSSSSSNAAAAGDDDAAATDDGNFNNSAVYGRNTNLSEPFLAFYMILFAVLLFCYELMWWTPLDSLNENMRKNFGFMYGLRGKGLYLVFVAFLCFGLGNDARVRWLNYLTGCTWLLGGCLHIFVICTKPEIAREYLPAGQKSAPEADNTVV